MMFDDGQEYTRLSIVHFDKNQRETVLVSNFLKLDGTMSDEEVGRHVRTKLTELDCLNNISKGLKTYKKK